MNSYPKKLEKVVQYKHKASRWKVLKKTGAEINVIQNMTKIEEMKQKVIPPKIDKMIKIPVRLTK